MGIHEEIDVVAARAQTLDWSAFRSTLEAVAAGPALPTRRVALDLGDIGTAQVSLAPMDGPIPIRPHEAAFTVGFGPAELEIVVDRALLQVFCDAAPVHLDVGDLRDGTLALVVEHLLAGPAEPLEAALGGDMRLRASAVGGVATTADGVARFGLSVSLNGRNYPLRVVVSTELENTLMRLFPAVEPTPSVSLPSTVPFPASLRSPEFRMPADEVHVLVPNDVVVLDKRWAIGTTASLVVGSLTLGATARDADTRLHRLTTLVADAGIKQRNLAMTPPDVRRPTEDTTAPQAPAVPRRRPTESMAPTTLQGLPVSVSVELERSEMTLGALKALAIGTVLPFSGEVSEKVTLLANGEPFARGELVRIGERTGVRIQSLD